MSPGAAAPPSLSHKKQIMNIETNLWVHRNEVPLTDFVPVRPISFATELLEEGIDARTAEDTFADVGIDVYVPHKLSTLNSLYYSGKQLEVVCVSHDLLVLAEQNWPVRVIAYAYKATNRQLHSTGEETLVLLVEPVIDRVEFHWQVDDDLSWFTILLNGKVSAEWRYQDGSFKDWLAKMNSLNEREWTKIFGYQNTGDQIMISRAFNIETARVKKQLPE